jgi:lipopolysaccharide/colanic/teichoic acid biosynthesis glycosyltransferase
VFDVLVSGSVLLVTSPVVALAMLAIRLESPGHPIYRQRRIGKDGAAFDVLKLRTMVSGAEKMGAGLAVDDGDSRITRVGALLRRTSIDELPNLVNVLRGEMSIIGPRPTVPVQVAQYTELDLWYVEHASLRLDLRILWLTARMLVTGHGLYKGETGGWVDPS